jgi:hypothetical protein
MSLLFRQLTLLLFFTALSGLSFAQTSEEAGLVIITSGPFQAVGSNNQLRNLIRGSHFFSGDMLKTGTNSTAQVRFSDGTVMALYPNSQVKVNDYSYHQNSKSDKSVVSLVKGGFRALTGLISKENPDAYKLQTPVAVIGVRGTNYGGVLDRGRLFTGVWKGGIIVQNQKGLIKLGEGGDYNYAQVLSKDTAPIGLLYPPAQLVGQCGYN